MATSDDKTPVQETQDFKQNQPVDVPPVTANTDSTPKSIAVGAAVLLGLAFGLGCWVWCDGEGMDQPMPQDVISYHTAQTKSSNMGLPTPFALYGLDYTTVGGSGISDVKRISHVPVVKPVVVPVKSNAQAPAQLKVAGQPLVYLFNYGQAGVPENSELSALAEKAGRNGATLDVRAYADEHGNAACNRRLSEKRAKAVAAYLEAHGVPASQIKAKGMGPTHAYANDAQDRRAEVYVEK